VAGGSAGSLFGGSSSPALPLDVIAPPELCTIPERGSFGVVEFEALIPLFAISAACWMPDSTSCTMDDTAVDNEFDGAWPDAESGVDDVDEVVSDPVSAKATPGGPATPNPTPNATASVPTRPMCLAYPIAITSPQE
jgi:hypothetical protein